MNELKKINTIAYYTSREILKSKILLNVLLLGVGLLITTYVAFSFTYGEPSRVALDFGLGTLSLSSVGIAIFIGVSLLSKEIDNRTVYMVVSRPVARSSFILGKIIGLSSVLFINILLLSALTLACYFFVGGEFNSLILWAIVFTAMEAILVLLVVAVLSLLTSNTLSILFTLMLYVSGHAISGAKLTLFAKNMPGLIEVLDLYHFVLPAFYKLNIKDFVLYQNSLESSYILNVLLYGFLYSGFLSLLAIFIFNKKNLD